jgi:hypothetical protein
MVELLYGEVSRTSLKIVDRAVLNTLPFVVGESLFWVAAT